MAQDCGADSEGVYRVPWLEEWELLLALDKYRKSRGRPLPTWREVMAIFYSLGYRKVEDCQSLPYHVSGGSV